MIREGKGSSAHRKATLNASAALLEAIGDHVSKRRIVAGAPAPVVCAGCLRPGELSRRGSFGERSKCPRCGRVVDAKTPARWVGQEG